MKGGTTHFSRIYFLNSKVVVPPLTGKGADYPNEPSIQLLQLGLIYTQKNSTTQQLLTSCNVKPDC